MNAAAGEANQRAVDATSSGKPQRRNGVSSRTRSCQRSEAASPQAVRIQPGARQFTRTFGANVNARLRVKAITAALAAPKSWPLSPSIPVSAWSQPIVRITPPRLPTIRSPTARDKTIVAVTSTACSSAHFRSNDQFAASVVSRSTPALFTQMSTPPSAQASSTSLWQASASRRSAVIARLFEPRRAISPAVE